MPTAYAACGYCGLEGDRHRNEVWCFGPYGAARRELGPDATAEAVKVRGDELARANGYTVKPRGGR